MSILLIPITAGVVAGKDFTVYDAYIENQGLIFYNAEETRPQTVPLRQKPVRQDVGNNPNEIRPEFGDFFAQSDFSHGSFQNYFHRRGGDEKKVLFSEGFDISEPGLLTHLRDVATIAAVGTAPSNIVQFNSLPFVGDGNRIERGDGSFPGIWTTEDPHLAEGDQTVHRLATSGEHLYAAVANNGIHRRDTAGTWTHYVTYDGTNAITLVAWIKNRLVAADGRKIYEITASGTLPAALETLPTGWVFKDIFEIGGFIYAIALNSTANLSEVHHYGLNDAGSALELKGSTQWPRGQRLYAGAGTVGTGFVGGGVPNSAGGYDPVLYQVNQSDTGFLTFAKVAQADASSSASDNSCMAIEPVEEDVLVGWNDQENPLGARGGLAIYSPKLASFSMHLKKTTAGNPVIGILFFKGRLLFSATGDGLFYEDLTKYVATATLVTSVADWNNAGQKVWDQIELSHKPLSAGTQIVAEYTLKHPDEDTWVVGLTSNITSSEGAKARLTNAKSRLFALKKISSSNGAQTLAPEPLGYSVRSNPAPVAPEFLLERYIRLVDKDRKDEQGEEVYQDPDAVVDSLEDLLNTWVTFYEPGFTWTAWVGDVSRIEPEQPLIQATAGEPLKNAYVVRLVMTATKQ